MLCFGHRGAKGYKPENTLKSISHALTLGVYGVEVDVRSVGDELILLHDDTLNRTTNGHGHIEHFSLSEIRTFDAGDGEKIPLLSEVFSLVNEQVVLNVEIKGLKTAETLCKKLTALVQDGYHPEKILVSSFNHQDLFLVKEKLPSVPLGVLLYGIPHDLAAATTVVNATSIHISREYVSTQLIIDARKRGVKIFVYTVNEPEEITRMEALGVDGVFSDYPDLIPKSHP